MKSADEKSRLSSFDKLPFFEVQLFIKYIFWEYVMPWYCFYGLDWSVYTCLTQLYGGRDMYNLLHKEQLHVSALFIGHLQVDN